MTESWVRHGYMVIRFACPGHPDCFTVTCTMTMLATQFAGAAALGQHIARTVADMGAQNGNRSFPLDTAEFRAEPEILRMLEDTPHTTGRV